MESFNSTKIDPVIPSMPKSSSTYLLSRLKKSKYEHVRDEYMEMEEDKLDSIGYHKYNYRQTKVCDTSKLSFISSSAVHKREKSNPVSHSSSQYRK